jgi:hypothetical protein
LTLAQGLNRQNAAAPLVPGAYLTLGIDEECGPRRTKLREGAASLPNAYPDLPRSRDRSRQQLSMGSHAALSSVPPLVPSRRNDHKPAARAPPGRALPTALAAVIMVG